MSILRRPRSPPPPRSRERLRVSFVSFDDDVASLFNGLFERERETDLRFVRRSLPLLELDDDDELDDDELLELERDPDELGDELLSDELKFYRLIFNN